LAMAFLHLFIVNKSGGLIHHRSLSPRAPKIGTNEWLRIGSTFHSLHAIAAEASPIKKAEDGIEVIEGQGIVLCCFQTRTGIKFALTAEPGTQHMRRVLREIYVSYADCALKDPFYELDMPIRSELFSQALNDLMVKYSSAR